MSDSGRPRPGGLADRLAAVQRGITAAVAAAGRDPEEVTTIVVTKFQPVSLLEELAALGVRDFGESRHQEAQGKAAALQDPGLTWHFVGQVQGKKARQVRAYADVIHSVDRTSLVDALGSDESVVDCFVQVNLTDDPARGGVAPGELHGLVEHVLDTAGVRLLGLMAVAPIGAEPRRAFARVRELGETVQQLAPHARYLSMGMSADYAEAISEGATHLRIGTAITGNRPVSG
ncbi:YggS family pyridoxal phosphate-dependent enzyme [Cryobacterium sinapicolor]|uniref:Pyridoxal phosphate homeostasis protein n=1 Tax=Cryobacterium sinapicolor TaxID=1259236 RepID=A0ABY2IV95_9MICO|nr:MULTISPECIES: YggS family pyridoxal phosphate-dependent enzyme [Cryobacterium]TFC92555.1 YggS family pyridoxal phosphate-dependent enzyme [Cryobacterium sp. TMT3-29-2]TFC95537.1 YggS family pyridoxal phosphate-dependent enzyme [Cryobacterium sinapicolor]